MNPMHLDTFWRPPGRPMEAVNAALAEPMHHIARVQRRDRGLPQARETPSPPDHCFLLNT